MDTLLLQVRLTTLMQGVDASHIVWGLLTLDEKLIIRTSDKKGTLLTFNVNDRTLDTIVN